MAQEKYKYPRLVRVLVVATLGVIVSIYGNTITPTTASWRTSAHGLVAEAWALVMSAIVWGMLYGGLLVAVLAVASLAYSYVKYRNSLTPQFERNRRHHTVGQPANRYDDVPRKPQAVVDSPRWS